MAQGNKQPINEGLTLDKIFKYTLTAFFGSGIIDKEAKKAAAKDPEIKKKISAVSDSMKSLHDGLKDLQARYNK